MRRRWLGLALLLAVIANPARAQDEARMPEAPEVEVKREDRDEGKLPTLRFLRENRDFLRAQLDLLRQIVKRGDGEADLLSDRHLMFRDMLDEILAAQDTVAVERSLVDQWTLLESVRELGDLEAQLDLMETLLGEQQARLSQLEADFVGRQETALVILLRAPGERVPTAVVFEENGEALLRVPLDEAQREALAKGGIAQLYHELVEPRALELRISLEGPTWQEQPARMVHLEPERDRLTFLELDLSAWSGDSESWTSTWAK